MDICITDYFDVHLKLTQHYKSTIFQGKWKQKLLKYFPCIMKNIPPFQQNGQIKWKLWFYKAKNLQNIILNKTNIVYFCVVCWYTINVGSSNKIRVYRNSIYSIKFIFSMYQQLNYMLF